MVRQRSHDQRAPPGWAAPVDAAVARLLPGFHCMPMRRRLSITSQLDKMAAMLTLHLLAASIIGVPAAIGSTADSQCSSGARLHGSIRTRHGKLQFNGQPASLTAKHCIDIDPADQGGCVSSYSIETRMPVGCRLKMEIERHPVDDVFEVRGLRFVTDSLCRGWRDAVEGAYDLTSSELDASAPKQVARGQETKKQACFRARIRINGKGTFSHARRGSYLPAEFTKMYVSGVAVSAGRVNKPCLRKTKPRKKPRAKIPAPQRPPRQRRPPRKIQVLELPPNIRLDFGAGAGWSADKTLFTDSAFGIGSARLTRGTTWALTVEYVPALTREFSSAGAGLAYILSADAFELQPRITLDSFGGWTNSLGLSLGATARLFINRTAGVHVDVASAVISGDLDWSRLTMGLSLRF